MEDFESVVQKGVRFSDIDYEILNSLYKFDWLHDYHLSVIVGENREYVKGRLKKLAKAGYIERLKLAADRPACNWLTRKGMRELGVEYRTIRRPTLAKYEHDLGSADACMWFTLPRRLKDGSVRRKLKVGQVISERDFNAVREMELVGTKKNGQPVYVSKDADIHRPDGYFVLNGKYSAIEYERTTKSSKRLVERNVLDLAKRFSVQYWFCGKASIIETLQEIRARTGVELKIMDIATARRDIQRYVDSLPAVISQKSGVPRDSAYGEPVAAVPLNRIPLISSPSDKPMLETRTAANPVSKTELPPPKRIALERRP